jgi:tRNA pseudouridine13 synthase
VTLACPCVSGTPEVTALLRAQPEDFRVYEELGFELSGEGEHVFLHLEKRELNSLELHERIASLSGIPQRDIGLSGMKDRNAITRQWFSVRMAGKQEPDWNELERDGDVTVLQAGRHLRKLKRGTHKSNRFELHLRELHGPHDALVQRLERVKVQGVPNYFGEQRFGRNGSTLEQARRWMQTGGRKISRTKRSLYLCALRAHLFNTMLAARVNEASWNQVREGDVCILSGSRSLFRPELIDEDIKHRCAAADIHPGLPLWGTGEQFSSEAQQSAALGENLEIGKFLQRMGLEMAYRASRALPDDFCWQFCDDGSLQLKFALGAGSYATAVLAELVQYNDRKHSIGKRDSSE